LSRIALFVDVQNIYYTTRDTYGRQFDYRKLWAELGARGEVAHAIAYAIARDDDRQKKFQSALRHIGFEVKLKPYIARKDGSSKGDWDVGITIDVLEIAPRVDAVTLLSGDGDFGMLMRKVATAHGTRTEVYGVRELTARSLIESVDAFHPIDERLLV